MIIPNLWEMLTVVSDGESTDVYRNGQLVAQQNGAKTLFNGLTVGANRPWDTFYEGQVDDVMAWNYALTATEVRALIFPEGDTVLYVDDDAPANGDGQSWDTAFSTLQDALAVITDGGTVYLAGGTYRPDQGDGQSLGDRSATFALPAGIRIHGSLAGIGAPDPNLVDAQSHPSILSGDLSGNDIAQLQDPATRYQDNSYHVVTVNAEIGANVLSDVTITGGNADGSSPADRGGGVYVINGGLELWRCQLIANQANQGGAIACEGVGLTLLDNCLLTGNRAVQSGGCVTLLGNNIFHAVHCTMADNAAKKAAAVRVSGGASATIYGCILWNVRKKELQSVGKDTLDVDYSIVYGGWAGTENIDQNPQFVQHGQWNDNGSRETGDDTWTDGNYRLVWNSPAIEGGDPDFDLMVGETDLDGEDRLRHNIIDMGPYEKRFFTLTTTVTGTGGTLASISQPAIVTALLDPNNTSPQVRVGTGVLLASSQQGFPEGQPAVVLALPDPNTLVSTWTGSDNDTADGIVNTVTLDTDKTVSVAFEAGTPGPLTITRVTARANRNRGASLDLMTILGEISGIDEANLQPGSYLNLGLYNEEQTTPVFTATIAAADAKFKNGVFNFRSTSAGLRSLQINLKNNKLNCSIQKADLSGLKSPIFLRLLAGDQAVSELIYDSLPILPANETDLVNGKALLPTAFLWNVEDALRVEKVTFREGKSDPDLDQLTLRGTLALADMSTDLSLHEITVSAGNFNTVLPAGSVERRGTKNQFNFVKPDGFETELTQARFDLDKGTFNISIKNANVAAADTRISFTLAFDSYNQSQQLLE